MTLRWCPPGGDDRFPATRGGAGGRHEHGFVLVGALLIMLLLVLIGISATTATHLELQMASANRAHTETFFHAEGGLEVATFLLEENIICAGFDEEALGEDRDIGPITVANASLNFWEDDPPVFPDEVLAFVDEDPTTPVPADFVTENYPWPSSGAGRRTRVLIGGEAQQAIGGSVQMAAGYVGVGKSAATSGSGLVYDMYVQHQGSQNMDTLHQIRWRTTGLQEGGCTVD